MQYLKPKFLPQAEQKTSEKKSGIKDIICPEPCAPLWQRAFTLADNVRFTRTPDNEIVRRRAAIDPVYAKILAEAQALKSARHRQLAEDKKAEQAENQTAAETAESAPADSAAETAGKHEAAAEPERAPENRGYETIAHMREEAEAAFSAAAASPGPAPAAAAPALMETKEEQKEQTADAAPATVSAPSAAAPLPYSAVDAPPASAPAAAAAEVIPCLPAAVPEPAADNAARQTGATPISEAPDTVPLIAESPLPQEAAPVAAQTAPAEKAAVKVAAPAEKTAPAAKKAESAPEEVFPWNMAKIAAKQPAEPESDSAWISRRPPQNGGHGLWISRRHAQAGEEAEKSEAESAFAAMPGMPAAPVPAAAPPQMDITRLFKMTECRRPQLRWIPVPAALATHLTETHIVAGLAAHYQQIAGQTAPETPGSAEAPVNPAEFSADGQPGNSACSASGYAVRPIGAAVPSAAFAAAAPVVPTLNLQLKLDGYNSAQDRLIWEHHQDSPAAAGQNAPQSGAAANSAAAANLDALCSSAVEKSGKNAAPAFPPAHGAGNFPGSAEKAVAAAAAALPPAERSAPGSRPKNAARPSPQAKHETRHGYKLPAADLLQPPVYHESNIISQEVLERSAGLLESVLEDFGVKGEIIHVRPGPVVTLYEFEPAPGVKSSRVIGLSEDIARSMSSVAARVAVIPGRNVIGIELPNKKREMVYLREILQSAAYKTSDYKLPLALGKNIGGEPIIAELAKMPHLLVAGTTGSGKSVAINTMILSLIYRMTPQECRLIMVDPKMLELSVYDGIPHLLTPVVTDPKKALSALKWAVREMEARYRKMAKLGVRNIDGFNARVREAVQKRETIMCTVQAGFDKETGELLYTEEAMDLQPLPYIVIIVDEMADLMMVAGKEIEGAIQRLAQMARAAGIHLIMATQRPSVDVITGTIKANFPTRISFQVTSKIDSRTILGEQGAEALLGQGDMLHMAGGGRLKRVHGPFVSDREVEKVVAHLKTQGTPEYLATVTESNEDEAADGKNGAAADGDSAVAEIVAAAGGGDDFDDLYLQAVKIVMRDKKCSTSYIQRRLGIGYNKAATLVEKMEEEGLVGEANHVGKREILINS